MPLAPSRRLFLGLLLLAGCSKEAPSTPPASFSPPPPSVPASSAPAQQASAPAKPAAGTNDKPALAAPKPLPAGASLIGGPEPNAFVISREDRPELLATIMNPESGVNSSLVSVVIEREDSKASAALPKGFSAISDARIDPSGYPLRIRCDLDGAVMAFVPGGLAVQGADGTAVASPRHPIDVDAFYIDVHEVTVERYLKFREASKGEKTPPGTPLNASSPQQPAVGVNWRDAMQYAKWAGKELPTESEWEKAARGVNGFTYPWGEERAIWERRRAHGQIDDVGSFRTDESVYGVMDLAGNAREWCQDFFAEDAYKQVPAAGSAAARNWKGPRSDKAGRRVVKGSASGWELWAREGLTMAERSPQIGFRCVLRLSQVAAEKPAVAEAPPSNPNAPPKDPLPAPKKSAF